MFTGIVEDLGRVTASSTAQGVRRISVRTRLDAAALRLGASIALNGVCLTIVAARGRELTVQAVPETLRRTNLGGLAPGSRVNVERPLAFGSRMGGHYVQGHVDASARLLERRAEGGSEIVRFETPPGLGQWLVSKGFVALDGVSLTVVDPTDASFAVALVPHTRRSVTLGAARVGYRANLEVDVLAKYGHPPAAAAGEPEPSIAGLRAAGFRLDDTR